MNKMDSSRYLAEILPGACKICGTYHTPDQPCNEDSLYYKYRYYDKYGCFPPKETRLNNSKSGAEIKEMKKKRKRTEKKDKPEELIQLSGQTTFLKC